MTIAPVTVLRPTSVTELHQLLREYGEDAYVYAGATELVVAMKLGLSDARLLIDLKGIAELADVMIDDDQVRIGATTTHRYLERDHEIAGVLPVLSQVERHVANARVRAIGTLGGNLAFGEPHSDPATFLVAADARYLVAGADGTERSLGAAEFLRGPFEPALDPGEIMTEIQVPLLSRRVLSYRRFVHTERPVANVAVRLDISDRIVDSASVVVGAAIPVPTTIPEAAHVLRGVSLRPDTKHVASAANVVAERAQLAHGGDPDYLRQLLRTLTTRALLDAFERAEELPPEGARESRPQQWATTARNRLARVFHRPV